MIDQLYFVGCRKIQNLASEYLPEEPRREITYPFQKKGLLTAKKCSLLTFILSAFAAIPVSSYAQSTSTILREFYPGSGLLRSESRDGVITNFTYLAGTGDLETITDARGYVTRYGNYKRGIAQTEIHAEGKPEQVTLYREVTDIGCIASETDGEGNKTIYGRDDFCRISFIGPAEVGSASTTISYVPYNANTPETHTLTRGNYVSVKKFDDSGRLIEQSAGGVKRAWRYDEIGRKTFESYPVDVSSTPAAGTSFAYDAWNRVTTITHTDGSFSKREYLADASRHPQTKITDERGNVTNQIFRAFGSPSSAELMAISTPVPAADISLARNVRGQVTQVVQGGLTRNYGYDTRYYLTSVVNPETGTTTYGRDALGNLTSVQVGTTGTTFYDLDGLNQVYAIRYPDSSKNANRTWYKTGKPKTASRVGNTLTWKYDDNNNLIEESLAAGAQNFVTTYGYDSNDRLSSIAYPKNGSILDLAPDILGRPTQVGSYATGISYHPVGLVKLMTYANGVVTTMSPDSRQRPATVTVGKGGGDGYLGLVLAYDAADNNSAVKDTSPVTSGMTRSYGYDGINRLNRVTTSLVDYPITYDGTGNITQQNFGGTLNYTYDATSNRLTSTSGIKTGSYLYDARGNVTSNGNIDFQYDDNSRLRCAKCGTADQIAYDYDAIGRRMSRTKAGQTAYLVYSESGALLMEFNPTANQRQEHIYLGGQKIATKTQSAYFATALSISASSADIGTGQAVTLTATLTGGNAPNGRISFYDNGVPIGSSTLVNGKATLTTSGLTLGAHNFTAFYSGDGANATSNTTVTALVQSGSVSDLILNIINVLLED